MPRNKPYPVFSFLVVLAFASVLINKVVVALAVVVAARFMRFI